MAVDIIKRELPQDLMPFDDPENYEEKYEEESRFYNFCDAYTYYIRHKNQNLQSRQH